MKKLINLTLSVLILSTMNIYSQQTEISYSSFPVLKVTRTSTISGGGLNTFDGINSGLFLNTKTSSNMTDGFGGGLIFGINDNTLTGNNYIARIYARRDGGDNLGLLQFCTGTSSTKIRMTIRANGFVGIGTVSPAYKLDVLGTIRAQGILVDMNGADFVFDENYNLKTLDDVESFVKENKHLPGIEPAIEMEKNGAELGELNTKLLQKIEELTLYMIEINKEVKLLKQENSELKSRMGNM